MTTPKAENMHFIDKAAPYIPRGNVSLLDIIRCPSLQPVDEKKKSKIAELLDKFGFEDKRFIKRLEDKQMNWSGNSVAGNANAWL